MRFERLDLNLLVALDVLLNERSVSLAADRLCLSQSATSSALGRLRDYFEDDLLVLKGRQMILTPRAEDLIEPVRAVLEQIRSTIAVAPEFDPATCDRQIRIMASDFVTEVFLTGFLAQLEHEAPNMRFEIQAMSNPPVNQLERGAIDLLFTVDFAISSDHPSVVLFQDDHVLIADEKNEQLSGEVTPELYFELGHVTTRFGKARVPVFEDWFLNRHKKTRRVEVVAPTFLSLPGLVLGTQRVATVHRQMAKRMCTYLPLVMREIPFDIPHIREALQWNVAANSDSVIRWIVGEMKDYAFDEFGESSAVRDDAGAAKIALEFQTTQKERR